MCLYTYVHVRERQYRRFGTRKIKTELMKRYVFYSDRENPCFGIRRIKMYGHGSLWFTVIETDNTRWHLQNKVWCDEALYDFLWERESALWHPQNKHRKMKHCNFTVRDSEKAHPSNVEVNEHCVISPSDYFRNLRLIAYVGWGERTVFIHWCST